MRWLRFPQKTFMITLSLLALSGLVLSSCAGPRVQDKESEIQALRSQVDSLQTELEEVKAWHQDHAARLERELEVERKKVGELIGKIRTIQPPIEGQVLPVSELVAIPENYLDKEIIVEGSLYYGPEFRDTVGHLIVRDLNSSAFANIHCYFRPRDLDPESRRLLVAMKQHAKIRMLGRLVNSSEGLGREMGMPRGTGYEFLVARIAY
ncbi:MAG: hypothetical protein XU15_C0005G0120 [candidate division NC10 bacterium CSP1-5]|nr:MAG: hypothetical protein XU15_C0005G0120 [candidate division NC10 bacterium CSP1-5]